MKHLAFTRFAFVASVLCVSDAPQNQASEDAQEDTDNRLVGEDLAAFQLVRHSGGGLPVLIGAPHGGRFYSESVRKDMRGGAATRARLEDRHIDTLAQAVAQASGADCLIAQAPRAMIDLNRASDDIDWTMIAGASARPTPRHSLANRRARSGLGLIPRRLPGLGEIWKQPLPQAELDRRIAAIHRPYHAALSAALEQIRDRWGTALLVDLHSMPPLRKRFPDEEPADIVVGDRFGVSCDPLLSAYALSYFAEADRRAAHNRPYSGGYILDCHAAPGRGIHAIQIELCRSLYLDAQLDRPSVRLGAIVRMVTGLIRGFAQRMQDLSSHHAPPLAAE